MFVAKLQENSLILSNIVKSTKFVQNILCAEFINNTKFNFLLLIAFFFDKIIVSEKLWKKKKSKNL